MVQLSQVISQQLYSPISTGTEMAEQEVLNKSPETANKKEKPQLWLCYRALV